MSVVQYKQGGMEIVEFLKSDQLVANIQNYFGVELHSEKQPGDLRNGSNSTCRSSNNKSMYIITNKFWYYLFKFGTELGDELFYSMFIPFWFWNVDGAVGRRVILVWAIVMCIGQGIKDVVRWSRPGYPAVKLQNKWVLEYGMPSTHAMVGVSIPFSVLLFTLSRYQYNILAGLIIAILWCMLICISRVYLGMHSVLDIIAGLVLSIILMFPLVPLADQFDNYFLTSPTGPLLCLVLSILVIIYYPNSDKWTPTRGDTTMIVSVCVGVQTGSWLNYQTGVMSASDLSPPYAIMWPSYLMIGRIVTRTLLGFLMVFATRIVAKNLFYNLICSFLRLNPDVIRKSENTLQNKQKAIVELGCKYLTYSSIGFNILYTIPIFFRLLGIERPTFYTEI